MNANDNELEWARQVVVQGWPDANVRYADLKRCYEDLEAAYYALQEEAAAQGFAARARSYEAMADRAYRLATGSASEEQQRW